MLISPGGSILAQVEWIHQIFLRLPFVKNEKDRQTDTDKSRGVIPTQLFAQIGHGKDGEDREGNDLLDSLELRRAEFERPNAIGGHLKAVFEESDPPTCDDDFPKSFAAVFEMAVPCEGHEDIGDGEKKDGAHEGYVSLVEISTAAASSLSAELRRAKTVKVI